MADIVEQLRSGLDNADGGEMGGVVLTMRQAADEIERLRAELASLKSDPVCATCGHPRSNHPYRHPFVGIESKEQSSK